MKVAFFRTHLLISLLINLPTLASALAEVEDITSLPEAAVRIVTKSPTGDQVQIGDRIPLDVVIKPEWIKGDSQFKLNVPEGSSKLTELGWYMDSNTLWVSGSVRIVVSPLKPGRLTLPTLVVKSKDQDFVAIARTQPISLNVIAPQKDQNSKVELLDPAPMPLPTKFIVLGFLVLGAALALGIWFYRKYKRRAKPERVTPPVKIEEPEHVIALKRLDTLFNENSFSPDAAKPIAFGISEVLKDFFSARFKVDASEATTAEMLGLLRAIGMATPELREVSEFFDELDQIKFVKREHQKPFTVDVYQRYKVKSLALVHRWARQIAPVAPASPSTQRGPQ